MTYMTDDKFPVTKTDEQWHQALSPEQYKVLRGHGTERAFTSPLNAEKREGTFVCAGCGQPLFSSSTKYESGTGWPSFYEPLEGAVGRSTDRSWFMVRTEVHCARFLPPRNSALDITMMGRFRMVTMPRSDATLEFADARRAGDQKKGHAARQ